MSPDFTSARFLGFAAPAGPAASASLGKPAALAEPPGADRLAALVARVQGAGAGLVARSTLHALGDVLAVADADAAVLLDAHCYPITRWAARAMREERTMITYDHLDAGHVRRLLGRIATRRGAPPSVVVADAWCAGCLRAAPLRELADAADRYRARLVVDDSLAFGVLGRQGMGTPRWAGLAHDRLVWVASAGKAYGTPLAVVTGPGAIVGHLRSRGPHRTHSSPPSTGDVAALTSALGDPQSDVRRGTLARRTHRLRRGVASLGIAALGVPLPVVGLRLPGSLAWEAVAGLHARGVEVLLTRSSCLQEPILTLCVRADHSDADVDAAVAGLRDALARAA